MERFGEFSSPDEAGPTLELQRSRTTAYTKRILISFVDAGLIFAFHPTRLSLNVPRRHWFHSIDSFDNFTFRQQVMEASLTARRRNLRGPEEPLSLGRRVKRYA